MEAVYWEVNGEVRVRKEEQLKRFEQLLEGEEEIKCLEVHEEGDQFGHFVDVIYAAPHPQYKHGIELFVERRWIPAFGYAWSERQIQRIEVY